VARLAPLVYPPIAAALVQSPISQTLVTTRRPSGKPLCEWWAALAGFTPDGLPVGVELLGRSWSEPQLIKLAYAYKQAPTTGVRRRSPPHLLDRRSGVRNTCVPKRRCEPASFIDSHCFALTKVCCLACRKPHCRAPRPAAADGVKSPAAAFSSQSDFGKCHDLG
jgi:hypothetical protein